MISIVIVTHGTFGEELLKEALNVVGTQEDANKNVKAISIPSNKNVELIKEELENALKEIDTTDGIIFLVDMPGGTPCNICLLAMGKYKIEVITGVNLYMVVTALLFRLRLPFEEVVNKIVEEGKKSILLMCKSLERRI